MAFIFNVLTIIVLLVGVYAFSYTFRLHKKGLNFASPYVGFILCWNFLILERLVFGYFEIGAFDMSRVDTWSTVLFVCDSILRVLAAFGSVYFFVRVLSYLAGKDMPRKLNISFSVAFISLSFFLGAGTGLAILDSNYEWLSRIQYYSINASLLLLLIFTVVIIKKTKRFRIMRKGTGPSHSGNSTAPASLSCPLFLFFLYGISFLLFLSYSCIY